MAPSPLFSHQNIHGNIFFQLQLKAREVGGKATSAPMDVRLDNYNVVQPNVFWRADDSRCALVNDRLYGPPELIVEILSPGTSLRDRRDKFSLYEQHGVQEYWIIDRNEQIVEQWSLVESTFERVGLFGTVDTITSPQLGTFEVSSFFID